MRPVARFVPAAQGFGAPTRSVGFAQPAFHAPQGSNILPAPTLPVFSSNQANKLKSYESGSASLGQQQPDGIAKFVGGYISDVIAYALESQSILSSDLSDARRVGGVIAGQLLKIKNSVNAALIDIQKKLLDQKLQTLDAKVAAQNAFLMQLSNVRQMPPDKFNEKIASYQKLFDGLTKDLLEQTKQEMISDMEFLVNVARGAGAGAIDKIKVILQKITNSPLFSRLQQQQCSVLVTSLMGATGTSLVPNEFLQKKLAEITTQKTILDKIRACKDAVMLVGPVTPLAEKEALITLVSGFVKTQSTLTRQDLQELLYLCNQIAMNAFILSTQQRTVMDQWLKSLNIAVRIATGTDSLMISLKKFLVTSRTDYALLVQAAVLAASLLVTAPLQQEIAANNQQSLLYKLKQACYYLYGQRANKDINAIKDFLGLVTLMKNNPTLKGGVVPGWETALSIDMALDPTSKKTVMEKLKDYGGIIASFTEKTDRYEKGLFINALTTIFSNRKDRSASELKQFKTLLEALLMPSMSQKRIFDNTTNALFREWKTILEGTLTLQASYNKLTLKDRLRIYQDVMPKISGQKTDYEKGLFIQVLSGLFAARGDFSRLDLDGLKNFFTGVRKAQGLLANNQVAVIDIWIKEIATAFTMTASGTYLDAIIERAIKGFNIDDLNKALGLFTSVSGQQTKNAFVKALNDLFTVRQKVDKKVLLKFLQSVDQKKIAGKPLLAPEQTIVLRQWIKTLGIEGVII